MFLMIMITKQVTRSKQPADVDFDFDHGHRCRNDVIVKCQAAPLHNTERNGALLV